MGLSREKNTLGFHSLLEVSSQRHCGMPCLEMPERAADGWQKLNKLIYFYYSISEGNEIKKKKLDYL